MTYAEKTAALKAALVGTKIPAYHFRAHKETPPYIVWHETSFTGLKAEERTVNPVLRFAVDYFSRKEYDDNAIAIKAALEKIGAVIDMISDYDRETGIIHYAYTVEV